MLLLIVILSFFLNFYVISNYGTGNDYYAASILSMTKSFKNFFFVAFDPSGLVSIDKPPVGFWMQAISVLIFGYHGWAMLLPQALAGTISCILIYILVAKYFKNRNAALISSLIFAITPSVVVVCRNNTIDMQLIAVLLLSTLFLFKSLDKGKWRYLFIAGILIGIGFNIKMFQAYMVVPAFALIYLIFAKEKVSKRFIAGGITIAIMFAVSISWTAIVELYPASKRPYVDSTSKNSVIELIFEHNGAERILGRSGMMGAGGPPQGQKPQNPGAGQGPNQGHNSDENKDPNQGPGQVPPNAEVGQNKNPQGAPPKDKDSKDDKDKGPGNGGGMGGDDIGNASPIRLWYKNMYGQCTWLILFVICSIVACFKKIKIKDAELKDAFYYFWILWFLTMFIFFSFAGFYHRYYLCMLAPSIAILSGMGIVKMFNEFKDKNSWKQYILIVALVLTMLIEFMYVFNYDNLPSIIIPAMIIATILAVIFIISNFINGKSLHALLASIFVTIAISIAPFYWALTPVFYVTNSVMPAAGPELAESKGGMGGPGGGPDEMNNSGLEDYLVKNYKEGSFLVVGRRSNNVAKYIINTGLPCYAYGGFLGEDNSLSLDKLKEYVKEGKITYFLISDDMGGMGRSSEITDYVKENATLIDPSEYGGKSNDDSEIKNEDNKMMGPGHMSSLYCFK